jgi:hypothetical protein
MDHVTIELIGNVSEDDVRQYFHGFQVDKVKLGISLCGVVRMTWLMFSFSAPGSPRSPRLVHHIPDRRYCAPSGDGAQLWHPYAGSASFGYDICASTTAGAFCVDQDVLAG